MLDKINILKKEENNITVFPKVNIYDKDKDIVLSVEMPGVEKDTLELNLDSNYLFLSGKRKKDDVGKDYKLVHKERQFAEYQRVFELNTDIDREKLKAEYKHGILNVFLTKSEKTQPKKIEIKT